MLTLTPVINKFKAVPFGKAGRLGPRIIGLKPCSQLLSPRDNIAPGNLSLESQNLVQATTPPALQASFLPTT